MNVDSATIANNLTQIVSQWGLKVVAAIALLIVGRIVSGWIRSGVARAMQRRGVDATLVPFVSGMAYFLAMAVVLIAVLRLVGLEAASLIAVLGAAGLAVGLALQGTLSNFAAGVMLLLFRPFQVGNYIEAGGTAGSVEAIGIFSTTLNTPDNVRIIVPNSAVYGSIIKNYSANETRRIDLVVGVSYDDDLGKAIEIVRGVLSAESRVLGDPAPTIAVSEMADSSVNIVVRPWCKASDYWPARFDLTRTLKEKLEAGGCSIPFPQRDVHVYQQSASA